MRRVFRTLATSLCIAAGVLLLSAAGGARDATATASDAARAIVLEVDGAIGPATADFVMRGIDDAERTGAALVILRLDTPGGLSDSMRDIIRRILASRVPVATFVAPSGARAASAGTYIMYASHVAAMAPATNLGSATPVNLSPGGIGGDERPPPSTGGPPGEKDEGDPGAERPGGEVGPEQDRSPAAGSAMERKAVNDAAAYIRGLAKLRGRNAEWAERAVREAVNLPASDALEENVIDYVARDIDDLLAQLDGARIVMGEDEIVMSTTNLVVETVAPDWRTRILSILTNPNVAYILMLAGVYGIFFELSSPGALFPGVLGAICLVLAFYAFQVLPVNYAGLALIVLGIAFIVGEAFMPSFGVLGIGGAAAFVIGSVILMDTGAELYRVSLPVIGVVTAVTVLFVFTVVGMAIRQRDRPVVTGREQMIGDAGEALEDFENGEGQVLIHGERWFARADAPIRKGERVAVRAMRGLTLDVESKEDES